MPNVSHVVTVYVLQQNHLLEIYLRQGVLEDAVCSRDDPGDHWPLNPGCIRLLNVTCLLIKCSLTLYFFCWCALSMGSVVFPLDLVSVVLLVVYQ